MSSGKGKTLVPDETEAPAAWSTCASCWWFSALQNECRRYPPVPSVVGMDAAGRVQTVSVYASVKLDTPSCGEHQQAPRP